MASTLEHEDFEDGWAITASEAGTVLHRDPADACSQIAAAAVAW
jgi:hypothetical protein